MIMMLHQLQHGRQENHATSHDRFAKRSKAKVRLTMVVRGKKIVFKP
jgi:hypothetical protein